MLIKSLIEKALIRKEWRRKNKNNSSELVNIRNPKLVSVGNFTYGGINALAFNDEAHLRIGHFCSIAPGVSFILSADHYTDKVSTFPFRVKVCNEQLEGISKGDICIGDDVWIGQNAMILSGVSIGQGAVIAAGAIVTHDVSPYAIVGGIPAKTIKYRFDDSIIQYLLSLDYQALSKELIEQHLDDLYTSIDSLSLDEIEKQFAWFPKKK